MSILDELAAGVDLTGPVEEPLEVRFRGAHGNQIRGIDWGGNGPNCLFLHGGAMSAETWTLCSLLLRDRYRCVALDLRGHGESDWCDDYTIAAQVDDIINVLAELGWSALHMTGMSLGGVVAAHVCARSLPQTINSLTLVDVAPGVSFGDVTRIRDFMSSERVSQGPEGLSELARRLGAQQSDAELLYRYRSLARRLSDGAWTWKHDTRRPTDFGHILAHIEEMNELASHWTSPCLIVRGGRSRILSKRSALAFSERCANGQTIEIDNAGHSVQEDNPVDLANALAQFWEGIIR